MYGIRENDKSGNERASNFKLIYFDCVLQILKILSIEIYFLNFNDFYFILLKKLIGRHFYELILINLNGRHVVITKGLKLSEDHNGLRLLLSHFDEYITII